MDVSLKLALLSVASMATLVALIFETVDKREHGLKRLTKAGWTSLALLLVSTGLGSGQIFFDRAEAGRLAAEKSVADERRSEAEQTIARLKDTPKRLEEVQAKLTEAEKANRELTTEVKTLTGDLRTAQSEVEKAKSQLKGAMDVRDRARRAVEDLPVALKSLLNGLPKEVKDLLGVG